MNIHLTPLALLAQVDRFQAMRSGLKPGAQTDYMSQLLLLLAVVITVVSVAIIVRLLNKRKQMEVNRPQGLFRELSRAHGLTRGEDKLLREVAAGLRLDHPSRLFLEPGLFDRVFEESQFAAWQVGEKRESLLALRDRLFGTEIDLSEAMGSL